MKFNKNVGGVDRALRIIAGIALIGAGVYTSTLWWILGVVVLATGVVSRCGIYYLFGVSTCKVPKQPSMPAQPTEPQKPLQ